MATNDLSNIFLVGLGAAATAVGVEGIHYMAINGKEIAHKGYEILHHSKKTSNLLEIEDTPNQKKTT